MRGTTQMPTSPRYACFTVHDFVGGSIFMSLCHLAMPATRWVVLPRHFTAAPLCQHSTSLLLQTLVRPRASGSATILLKLHLSVASALSNFSSISAAEATVAALHLLPVILTWCQQQRKEPKHSKSYLAETLTNLTGVPTRYCRIAAAKKYRDIVKNVVSRL